MNRTLIPVLAFSCGIATNASLAQTGAQHRDDGRTTRLYDLTEIAASTDAKQRKHDGERAQDIRGLIRKFVTPQPEKGFLCESFLGNGKPWLVAAATPARQKWIRKFLERNAAEKKKTITLGFRLLQLDGKAFGKHITPLLDAKRRPKDVSEQGGALTVGAASKKAFLGALLSDVRSIAAPTIVAQSLRRASALVGDRVAFVKDFDIQLTPKAAIADPVIDTVLDGTELSSIAAVGTGGSVLLDVELMQSKLERPIRQFDTALFSPRTKVTIQLPTTETRKLRGTFRLPPGALGVIAKTALGKHNLVLLVETAVSPR